MTAAKAWTAAGGAFVTAAAFVAASGTLHGLALALVQAAAAGIGTVLTGGAVYAVSNDDKGGNHGTQDSDGVRPGK